MQNIFARPLYVMPKPAGATCNLACKYCYYLEKDKLYDSAEPRLMSDETLERFIRDYINAQTTPEVLFTWHGGEPTLRPIEFYRRAMDLQRRYAGGRVICNALQTNGTLLTDEWCRFLKENDWLVGVSIDGPRQMHDRYRRSRGGGPSFNRVMQGIRLLQKHRVEWNAMAVVNRYNADHPAEFYRFFKNLRCNYIQLTPVVERFTDDGSLANPLTHGSLADFSLTPEQWGNFLCAIYDLWAAGDVGRVFINIFDATLANWMGQPPGNCTLGTLCGHAAAMEWNGDVYCCDHFVFPEYRLGNIREKTIVEMSLSQQLADFADAKISRLPTECRECQWSFLCHGECPKNRFMSSADGTHRLNYFCAGYRRFFAHSAPGMQHMKSVIEGR